MIDLPVRFALGALVCCFGRKLFWLVVAALGFIFAFDLTQDIFKTAEFGTQLIVGIIAGLIGAILAIKFKKVAISVAGFLAGMQMARHFIETTGGEMADPVSLLIMVVCGIVTALFINYIFDYALIVISSLWGSIMMIRAMSPEFVDSWPVRPILVILVLTIIGLTIQFATYRQTAAKD